MNKQFFSIITPTYNCGKFLKANIENLRMQSYKNYEHIVVDGGSIDNTIDLLKSYQNIKWISEKDEGMYDAINKGIKISSGNIIAYLNADDRYFPYTLEKVAEVFSEYTDVDFVYGYCEYINESEKPLYVMRPAPFLSNQILINSRHTWAQQSCFIKKEVFEKIGLFDVNFKYLGDTDFFKRMIRNKYKVKLIRKSLAKFMIRKSSFERALTSVQINEADILKKRYSKNKLHPYFIFNEILFKLSNIDSYMYRIIAKLKGNQVI